MNLANQGEIIKLKNISVKHAHLDLIRGIKVYFVKIASLIIPKLSNLQYSNSMKTRMYL